VSPRRPGFRHALVGLACWLAVALAFAEAPCRVAFDMGSSGIRAGYAGSSVTPRAGIDYLAPLWAGHGLETVVAATISALRNLPEEGRFPENCARVGGGFSAWRLALQQDPGRLTAILAGIEAASGVAILVMPPLQEGAYGYYGARQLLGDRLKSTHILDIGGGSLQIAGERTAYGALLGQKVWHQQLCREIRQADAACTLQPLNEDELAAARALLAKNLAGVRGALPERVTLTAISRTVSRGIRPVIERLEPADRTDGMLQGSAISAAIARVAGQTGAETKVLVDGTGANATYLLSSLLLVEGVLAATDGDALQVAEIDLTNLPGLLADDHAFAWQLHYGCYLARLQSLGIDAYASDPATCR
jgi:hypothetical protein